MQRLFWVALCAAAMLASCEAKKQATTLEPGFELAASAASDTTIVENLEVVGRVWGYVKYHHPIFANSTRDIDAELFALLPRTTHATAVERNKILCEWIDSLGEYRIKLENYIGLPENKLCDYQTDISWIRDTARYGNELCTRLAKLRYADRSAGNKYVRQTYYKQHNVTQENPDFSGENPYTEITDLDCGYRLMAAFRFWNMVEYFFPYKYLTDKPWSDVLPEYIARMIALPDGNYHRTMWRMIAEINDSHAANYQAQIEIFGQYRASANTAFVGDELLVTGDYVAIEDNGELQAGDTITQVNGKPIDYYIDMAYTYIPCSNRARAKEHAADIALRSHDNDSLSVHYKRNGTEVQTEVMLWPNISNKTQHSYLGYGDLSDHIYVNPKFSEMSTELLAYKLPKRGKKLIVDLRYHLDKEDFPNLMEELFPDLTRNFVKLGRCYTYPILSLPGQFAASATPEPTWRRPVKSDIKVIILVDNSTQSAAETWVQKLQMIGDAVVVGRQTAGANGNTSPIELPAGIKTCFSGLGWFYSDGQTVQRCGVRIDVEVPRTMISILSGYDEIADKGIEIIRRSK